MQAALLTAVATTATTTTAARLQGLGVDTHRHNWTNSTLQLFAGGFTLARTDLSWDSMEQTEGCMTLPSMTTW
jgi:hypothetical protein